MAKESRKILVTGGAGYIGSHTVHYLIKNGFRPEDIVVFDNLVYGHREAVPAGVKFVQGNLLNKAEIGPVFIEDSIDGVIHFAAYAFVGESMINPGKYFENNIVGGLNLLEAMLAGGCKRIVFSSTCATYGIPKKSPLTEDMTTTPINPYGETKLMFEKILSWYWEIHQLKSVRLRYFNAAGAAYGLGEEHEPETHLIPLVISAALGKRKSVSIFGADYDTPDGTCIRDYIHVLDLASAHLAALKFLDRPDAGTDFFNIGTGKGASVREVIDEVKKYQQNFTVRQEARRPGDPAELVADPTKAKDILGWQSQYSLPDIIKDAWEYHSK